VIGIVGLLLPFVISLFLGLIVGLSSAKAMRAANAERRSLAYVFIKFFLFTGAAVFALGVVLAVFFADVTDVVDGEANPAEFMHYMQFQWIVLSLFPGVSLLMSTLLARQQRMSREE
jgi:H+/Cl- antiporter ClcA